MRGFTLPSLSVRAQSWLVFFMFTALALIVNAKFLFTPGTLPWWDYAANDPLIKQAKHFELLHGNYSRVGFFHPGPFYLYLLALGEFLFHDLIPLFPTDIAAHFFVSALFANGALALCWWLGHSIYGARGGWIATVFTVTIGFHYSQVVANFYHLLSYTNFIFSPWLPHLYMVSCIYLTVAVLALFLRGPQWWPLIIFALLQLMHGHASFLLLAPIMGMIVLIGHAYHESQTPWQYAKENRVQLYRSLPIILIMALPMVLQLILQWPGEFIHYLQHANKSTMHTPLESLELYVTSLPLPILSALMLWLVKDRHWRIAGATWLFATTFAVWIYITKGVDVLRFRYLIFWYEQLVGTLFAFQLLAWAKGDRILRWIFIAASVGMIAASVRHYQPLTAQKYDQKAYRHIIQILQDEYDKRGMLAINMEKTAINVPIDDFLHMLIMLRAENQRIPFCFAPGSWNTMFLRETRCTPEQATQNSVLVSYPLMPFPEIFGNEWIHYYDMRGRENEMEPYILHAGQYNSYITPLAE